MFLLSGYQASNALFSRYYRIYIDHSVCQFWEVVLFEMMQFFDNKR